MERVGAAPRVRPVSWKWWICGLLLLASAINYMDRQTLANAAVRITTQFQLKQEQYGNLELIFGWAFAIGSTLFGIAVDRLPVRWLYPVVLTLWSVVGFATGLVHSYSGLLVCRGLLGLFEGGHWPCAIKTTQRLLAPPDRAMGNSVLQSGASIGAIVTPLIMSAMFTAQLGSWRMPFQVVGAAGLVWVIFWFAMVRSGDLDPMRVPSPPSGEGTSPTSSRHATLNRRNRPLTRPSGTPSPSGGVGRGEGVQSVEKSGGGIWRVLLGRRMLVLCFVVALINTSWQLLRAWLPKFLQEGRGYAETDAFYFNSCYYVATDVGCLGAGALTLWLARRGFSVHGSRSAVFLGCAGLSGLTVVAALLPRGWPLLAVLLLVGAGTLGLFPIYHALTQELSPHHQGKVTGFTGVAAWLFSSPAQKLFGRLIDRTGSFDLGLAVVGCLPLLAFLALWLFWDGTPRAGSWDGDSSKKLT